VPVNSYTKATLLTESLLDQSSVEKGYLTERPFDQKGDLTEKFSYENLMVYFMQKVVWLQ
jgi:hypothetical protein